MVVMSDREIRYDTVGRMFYHPDFHFAHKTRFSETELCYLAKYYLTDGRKLMAMALGRTEIAVDSRFKDLCEQGLLEYYRNLDLVFEEDE